MNDSPCFLASSSPDQIKKMIAKKHHTLQDLLENTTLVERYPRLLDFGKKLSENGLQTSDVPLDFAYALSLFNRHYYWECHEVLEDLWMEAQEPVRSFYQAIIQAAAAFYHVLNANPPGVLRLAESSMNKFSAYKELYFGVNIKELMNALENFSKVSRSSDTVEFDLNALPKITFFGELI